MEAVEHFRGESNAIHPMPLYSQFHQGLHPMRPGPSHDSIGLRNPCDSGCGVDVVETFTLSVLGDPNACLCSSILGNEML